MPKKKNGGGAKAPKAAKVEDNTPPLHELWTLAALHTSYEEVLRDLSQCRQEKSRLESEVTELKNTHAVTYEKFQQEFDQHKLKIETLMATAAASDEARELSDRSNKEQMLELSRFATEANTTLANIKGEWKDKQKLLWDAEGAVVRNAQLEIENSQLNRTVATLKAQLRRREKQLVVVKRATMLGVDEHHPESSSASDMNSAIADPDDADSSVSLCPLVLEAMKQFPSVVSVQRESLRVLSHLLVDSDTCLYLLPLHPLELALHAMRQHRADPHLQLSGSKVIWRIASSSPSSLDAVLEAGTVPMILNTLRSYRHSAVRRLVFSAARLLALLVRAKHSLPELDTGGGEGIRADVGLVRDGAFPRVEASRARANPPLILPSVQPVGKAKVLKKQSSLTQASAGSKKRGSLLGLELLGASQGSVSSAGGGGNHDGGGVSQASPRAAPSTTANPGGGATADTPAAVVVYEGSALMTTLVLVLDFLLSAIENERLESRLEAERLALQAAQRKEAEEIRLQQQLAASALRKGGVGNSSSPNMREGHANMMKAVASTSSKGGLGGAISAFEMGNHHKSGDEVGAARRKFGLQLVKGAKESGRAGEVEDSGLNRTMSMPEMKSYGAGNNIFPSAHDDEGGRDGEDDEGGRQEDGEDDVDDLSDGDEVSKWDPSRGESRDGGAGASKSKRRSAKTKDAAVGRKLDETISGLIASNTWPSQALSTAARDCLISCVMALDADDDGGASRLIERRAAQAVVVRAMGILEGDSEAMTAACMLIRASVKNAGESVQERDRMAEKLIEIGLAEKVGRLLEIHASESGKLNTECSAMIEELGTKFDRLLPFNM